jgi:hypothetical protein
MDYCGSSGIVRGGAELLHFNGSERRSADPFDGGGERRDEESEAMPTPAHVDPRSGHDDVPTRRGHLHRRSAFDVRGASVRSGRVPLVCRISVILTDKLDYNVVA